MKKLILLSLAVIFALGITVTAQAAVDNLYEVAVINYTGDVMVDPKGDGTWIKPWVGMKIMKDGIIKTGPDSTMDIVFDAEGLNVLQITANTQITIDNSLVHLTEGSVLAKFDNLTGGSTFTVKTPTAACGIRGSAMGIDFINGMTVVMAFEDKVYVRGIDAAGKEVGVEVIIPQGWKSSVTQGGKVTPPAGLSDNEKAVFDAFVAAVAANAGTAPADAADTYLGEEQKEDIDPDGKDLDEEKKDEDEDKDISPSY